MLGCVCRCKSRYGYRREFGSSRPELLSTALTTFWRWCSFSAVRLLWRRVTCSVWRYSVGADFGDATCLHQDCPTMPCCENLQLFSKMSKTRNLAPSHSIPAQGSSRVVCSISGECCASMSRQPRRASQVVNCHALAVVSCHLVPYRL